MTEPSGEPTVEPTVEPTAERSVIDRVRQRFEPRVEAGQAWLERRRREAVPIDLAVRFYERDRDSFASVLGAAIALRLFLFIVPSVVTALGLFIVIRGSQAAADITSSANVTGGLAGQLQDSIPDSRNSGWGLLLTGLVLTVWAGRSLTKVLAACAAGAWGLGGRAARATLRMAATVTTLVLLLFVVSALLNRVRSETGLAVITTSWFAAGVAYALGWFAVSWSLPRGTRDPGALLPGAVVVGVAMATLQWFMQFYLPARIERTAEYAGNLAWTIATLGYMFLVGRLMASSLILNATVWDGLGSISRLVFSLPVLRAVPRRFPAVGRFFDLDRVGEPHGVEAHDGQGHAPAGDDVLAAARVVEQDEPDDSSRRRRRRQSATATDATS